MKIISEQEFTEELYKKLINIKANSVTGPGRSGAIASVYVSHFLRIPWIPFKQHVPEHLFPLLIIDTTIQSGKTLRKLERYYEQYDGEKITIGIYKEPPRVHFWYERNNK